MKFDVPAGYQDPGSYLLALRMAFLQDPNAMFTSKVISVAKEKGAPTQLNLAKLPREKVKIPMGTFQAVKVTKDNKNKGVANSFWLAPSLGSQPIQLEMVKGGKVVFSEQLTRYAKKPTTSCLVS